MKPQPKNEIAIDFVAWNDGIIYFWASPDAASEFVEFGIVTTSINNKYTLFVDKRYNLAEVVAYIQNYDKKG